ncbi:Carboxymuconolactone decarboxylase family protein [uncultured archaeon]|nr:Carboxymuconolactone decarboxylase family protein [uncultured archaeon]
MTRIKPIEKEDASDDVRIIYREIEAGFGMVPNLFKTYAHFPALLRVNWDKTKALMMGGELSRELKESIAVVVSSANSCNYCVAAHSMSLQMMGFSKEKINIMTKKLESTGIPLRDQKILQYAKKATLTPHKITDSETTELRSLGLTDSQIVEILGVMELFTGYNKFLDALAVEIDFPEV